jgi:hypothetical protein
VESLRSKLQKQIRNADLRPHHVVPHRERLLYPLHNLRQLEPVRRLYVKRHPVRFNAEAPHFNREKRLRFAKHQVKKAHGIPLQEYWLMAVYRRDDQVPSMEFKYTRHSH